jgi:hypothetical protein
VRRRSLRPGAAASGAQDVDRACGEEIAQGRGVGDRVVRIHAGAEGEREQEGGEDAQAGAGAGLAVARPASEARRSGSPPGRPEHARAELEGLQQPSLRRHCGRGRRARCHCPARPRVGSQACGLALGAPRPPPPRLPLQPALAQRRLRHVQPPLPGRLLLLASQLQVRLPATRQGQSPRSPRTSLSPPKPSP